MSISAISSWAKLAFLPGRAENLSQEIARDLTEQVKSEGRAVVLHFSANKIAFNRQALLVCSSLLPVAGALIIADSNLYRRMFYIFVATVLGRGIHLTASDLREHVKVLQGHYSAFKKEGAQALQSVLTVAPMSNTTTGKPDQIYVI